MLLRLLDDLRDGLRVLTKSPGLSATAGLLIALVIGGNTTVYSMLNGVIRRPAPGVTATDLVAFGLVGHPGGPYFSYEDYAEYARATTTLRSLAGWGFSRAAFETPAGTYQLQVTPVTLNYFDTLGLTMAVGRSFSAEDDRRGAPLVAVISDAIWQTHFGGAASAIGSRVTINGHPATIVGVGPPRFAGPLSGEWTDVWVPMHAYDITPERDDILTTAAEDDAIVMIGRLAPGASIAQVRAEFETLRSRLDATSPRTSGGPTERDCPPQCHRAPVLVTAYAAAAGGFLPVFEREILAVFSIVTLLTLAVVGANVANLMLARSIARQRETAVRQSLGASRLRLVRLVLFEGLAISAVAGALALAIAAWTSSFVPTLLPQGRGTLPVDFSVDWRVAIYAGILTLAGTVLSSMLPALRAWRHDALPLLKDGAHTTTSGRSRVSKALVVLQLAFSVLLLTAAGLAYRSASSATGHLGFATGNLLLVNVGTAAAVQTSAENLVLLDRIRQRLAALPDVASATYMRGPWNAWNRSDVRPTASGPVSVATLLTVGDGYLETHGLKVVSGRELSGEDRRGGRATGVISQALASELFPGSPAVGRSIFVGRDARVVEIVGVAPDAYVTGFGQFTSGGAMPRPSYVFVPDQPPLDPGARPGTLETATYLVRHTGGAERVVAAIPGALSAIDRHIALASTQTLDSRLDERTIGTRLLSTLLMVFAAMSLLIAGVGQYAVVAFDMRRRTRDFGVRIALGASARDIVGSVVREGTVLTTAGLAAGFALSVALATGLRAMLFGVTPTDAPTYAAVFATLAAVSLVASYIPARRASRIDPVRALRQD